MKKLFINDKEIQVAEGTTILDAARQNGIDDIATLCYLKDCGNVGKCGVCAVEVEGKPNLVLSCLTKVEDDMVVRTNTEKVQERVKMRISALLNKHEFKCGPCPRRENCELLKLVIKTRGKAATPFLPEDREENIDRRSKSIVIDRNKCVLCGRCQAACKAKAGTEIIQIRNIDGVRMVCPPDNKSFDESKCLLCGQCVAACPVGALQEQSHIDRVKTALQDPEKHVIVAMAPAVRTAMGELFKMGYGQDVTGKLYSALRELGFNKVFDINFGADMTIMEEGTELLERIKTNGPFPMFTSCCPGWIREIELYFPEYLDHVSTAKSPQQEFGAASKSYYPHIEDIDPAKVFTVTIMPCTAKKFEADREEMENDGLRNIDAVITTRELAKLIKEAKIDFANLEDSDVDPAMGEYTGAGTIFGATGGVMEAALRTAKDLAEGADLENIEYKEVRGLDGIKEATVNIAGNDYNVAVIHGGKNIMDFFNSGKMNEKQYHFIEFMACPGGCVNGGGQPHVNNLDRERIEIRSVRASVLYNQDKNLPKRKSHKNAALLKMYDSYMGKPGHGKAHELLHHKYTK
ncbi:ferredoxin hydrogenase [uncultured Clostridium sp.]|uniref:ferredoxin hydrogenase n=1 Tax=uncultured Clostridium sp. TaxID=59620 RepID=UPI0026294DD8|nr:ferredoxin hydrogenase [uncultured Clostridium sp.]